MTTWMLASSDYTVTLKLQENDATGAMTGALVYKGRNFTVRGGWDASGSVPGRNFSAFSLGGSDGAVATSWIAASGIMTGSGAAPQKIDISVTIASSKTGGSERYAGVLTPWDGINPMDTFDHVVVLMLENRSFDNLLGYMYPDGVPSTAPRGKMFNGVADKDLSNPVPGGVKYPPPNGATSISVKPVGLDPNTGKQNYYQPYPDPGETYDHVNTQLFNVTSPPYNLPPSPVPIPSMNGFVTDYIENYKAEEEKGEDATYAATPQYFPWTGYKQIMECYPVSAVPVLTTLAEQFGVFDHWFCSVPSQTWCNRAFWNAGTSWGRVVNGPSVAWTFDSSGRTIFNAIEESGLSSPLNWKVYSANPGAALTSLVHLTALLPFHPVIGLVPNPFNHFYGIGQFLSDCESGNLTSYSFVEPRFFTPHNDMHPSSAHSLLYGPSDVGSVELGELFVWQVYNAVRNSPKRDRILLIITFDEHGGCYDHVPPPKVTPPDLKGYQLEDGFDFTRAGVRVPTIMISSHISKNTVINTQMDHGSFLKTMAEKWNRSVPNTFTPLTPPYTARVDDATEFSEVFTSVKTRTDWPSIPKPAVPEAFWTRDYSQVPLSPFQKAMVEAAMGMPAVTETRKRQIVRDQSNINTVGEAMEFFRSVPGMLPEEPLDTLE